MKTHNIGIIGYGGMGSYHHTRIEKPCGINFLSAYDISAARLEKAKNNGLETFDNLDDFLADSRIDAVLVAVPNDKHLELCCAAMNAGKSVICEKPVAINSEELDEMIECSKKNNVIFTVHQNRRMDEDYRIMKKIFDEKMIGDVFRIESRVQGSRGIADTWRRRKVHGGGMLYDWGVHLIDQMLCMVPGKVTSIFAEFQYISTNEVDDNIRLTMWFDSGVSALVEIGTCNFIMLPIWYMCGREGSAQIDYWNLEGRINHLIDNDIKFEDEIPSTLVGPSITLAPRAEDTMEELPLPKAEVDKGFFYKNFYDVLEGRAEPTVSIPQIKRSMKVIDTAFESGRIHKIIECDI
ncbi:MAG: Gfo/Idh/MocA family oxidoreductase [Clostridia bacterium]|nr:Gfo/Idh/MocA family oxidoreductase [Clostridia bacterium]